MLQQTMPAPRRTHQRALPTGHFEGSSRSASIVVTLILRLFPHVASVVDLGCGTGVWLRQFKVAGVSRVLGLDGGSADDGAMLLERNEFRSTDLATSFGVTERFDLATSFEMAQHLPPSAADSLVANLCQLSDVIVFSAAIPGQSGTADANQRWPSYWAALFDAHGYAVFDVLRPQVWYDQRIAWWYAQNTLVFVRRDRQDLMEHLRAVSAEQGGGPALDLVHPRCFEACRRSLEEHQYKDVASPKLAALEQRATDAEYRLDSILYSASWRITGPARRIGARFPRLCRWLKAGLAPAWRSLRFATRALSRSK
ncbi:methyltransferase domain-containing protein [Chelatococcus sp. GCM10030263]|uniref:methyltransferase domain-containing protein n=1 Tax=Chelatococcus sp. GCM10030263 TaxID=3273387 RepID=UPI0036150AE1